MLGFAHDVAFGTRRCFQGLRVTSSKSSLFHCRFFWIIVHTSCWHLILLSLRRLDLPCCSCKNRCCWGWHFVKQNHFFVWCLFAASAQTTKWCRLGEAVAAASKTCSLHSKDYDPCFIHWYQGTFLSRDKWETYLLRGLDTSFESRGVLWNSLWKKNTLIFFSQHITGSMKRPMEHVAEWIEIPGRKTNKSLRLYHILSPKKKSEDQRIWDQPIFDRWSYFCCTNSERFERCKWFASGCKLCIWPGHILEVMA